MNNNIFFLVSFVAAALVSCGGSNTEGSIVEDPGSCTNFFISNQSSYPVQLEYDGWGNQFEKVNDVIESQAIVKIDSACAIGSYASYPSEVFTEFRVFVMDNGEKRLVYSEIDNNVWTVGEAGEDGYMSQTFMFDDSIIAE